MSHGLLNLPRVESEEERAGVMCPVSQVDVGPPVAKTGTGDCRSSAS